MKDTGPHTPSDILPLQLSGLGFAVQGKVLLSDVTLTIRPRRRLVILGPNGAGKSLFLRLCHGLLPPTSGRVIWADGSRRAAAQAMVFQRPVMLRRSVRGNLDHALSLTAMPRRHRRAQVEAALARFGLTDLAGRGARLLSGGEQQRLALARAWASRPQILFLDEPSSALDPAATRMIEQIIRDFGDDGMTIVMTTHDLGQARRLADDVLFINKGRLAEFQPAGRFFDQPRTQAARAFLSGDLLW